MFLRKANLLMSIVVLASSAALAEESVQSQASVASSSDSSSSTMSLGPTLGLLEDTVGYGLGMDLLFDASSDRSISFGLHTGFIRWSDSASNSSMSISASLTSIPILATAMFRGSPDSGVHPYFGVSAGISITTASVSATVGEESGSGSASEVFFQGFARPGLEFGRWDGGTTFFMEPKVGLLKDQFVFAPTIGANFRI